MVFLLVEHIMDSKVNKNKINIDCYSEKDKKKYANFLLNNPDSNIYHTIEWKEIIENHYDFKPYYLIARDNNDNICAILPLFFIKNMCGKRLDSIPLSIYGGALGRDEHVKPLIEKIFELNRELKCDYIIIRQHPTIYGGLFESLGMKKVVNRWNQIVTIKKPEVLWKEIDKSNRNSIRKAISSDVHVERVAAEEELAEFHRLELLTRKRFGLSTPSLNFFKTIWKKLHSTGNVEVFLAKHEGRTIASTLIFSFNNRAIYGHANSETKHLGLRPNNLLLWRVMEWCYKKGYTFLELGATPYECEGLLFFKSSFNTINIPFAHYYYPGNTTLLDDTVIGKFGKKIIKKTPIFISREICPFLIKNFG